VGVAAIMPSGQVWAWGYNGDGEVGDGTTMNRLSPVSLANLSGVTQVSAGIGHTVALTGGGSVFTWGYRGYGEIGDGATPNSLVPVQVPGLSGVSVVAGGDLHSLAMTPGGALWAWGGNNYGQLGDGSTTNALTVEQISQAGAWTVLTDHYDMNGDSPAWTSSSDGGWTRHVIGLDGNLDATVTYNPSTGATATALQLGDLHGDVAATADPKGTGLSATYTYDAFGNPTDANTLRYGWLGGKIRATAGIGRLTLMGARLYEPAIGRFLQTDPLPGASCNSYDYTCQDPVNSSDLPGTDPDGDLANRVGATKAEVRWCMVPTRARICADIYVYARWAIQAQTELYGPDSVKYRSYGDAFRHMLWMGMVAWRHGYDTAIAAGRRHEEFPGNKDAQMAYWNNYWGAYFGVVARQRGLNETDAFIWLAKIAIAWARSPLASVKDRVHDPR
jgi:RHS repeat-associated protein